MTIDHTSVNVPNDKFEACLAIYLAGLEPLGYEKRLQFGPAAVGLGNDEGPIADYKQSNFWIIGRSDDATHSVHVAFRAKGGSRLLPSSSPSSHAYAVVQIVLPLTLSMLRPLRREPETTEDLGSEVIITRNTTEPLYSTLQEITWR
ncbi:glyoxalase family protein [Paramyrothecium foliicola]|nr:glyoxalase family protein [Paramyrothecium foliicola]